MTNWSHQRRTWWLNYKLYSNYRCLCCALHYQAHTLYLSPPPTAPFPAVFSPLLQLSSMRGTHLDDLTPRSPLCCLVDPLLLPSWGKVVTGIHTSLVCSCYAWEEESRNGSRELLRNHVVQGHFWSYHFPVTVCILKFYWCLHQSSPLTIPPSTYWTLRNT